VPVTSAQGALPACRAGAAASVPAARQAWDPCSRLDRLVVVAAQVQEVFRAWVLLRRTGDGYAFLARFFNAFFDAFFDALRFGLRLVWLFGGGGSGRSGLVGIGSRYYLLGLTGFTGLEGCAAGCVGATRVRTTPWSRVSR
jgi:hypothetical protein